MVSTVQAGDAGCAVASTGLPKANLGLPQKLCEMLLRQRVLERPMTVVGKLLPLFFPLLRSLPVRLRHAVIMFAWKVWVLLHKVLPGDLVRRGLSEKLSIEAHAISNVFWWSRLMPVSLEACRFMLGEIQMNYPPSPKLAVERIEDAELGARGYYLRLQPAGAGGEPAPVLLWFFGGAFVGGNAKGNIGLAERYGRQIGCDVFVTEMRLVPEHTLMEPFQDACRAYEWLLTRVPAEKIQFLGISSGGGCATRVLQLARADLETRRRYFAKPGEAPLPMPAGAMLLGPFVSYVREKTRTMRENPELDLVVNPRVVELCEPLVAVAAGNEDEQLRANSPLYNSFEGLCPLLVSASEHEACWDEDAELVRRAKAAGVDAELRNTPYQSHVFQMFAAFVPEALKEEQAIVAWARARGPAWSGATR